MIICPYILNPSVKQEYVKKVHQSETSQIQAIKADENAEWLREYYKFLIKNLSKH